MNKKINYLDLFAGCGGLSEGFEYTGIYKLLAAVEWEKYPVLTLKKRLKEKWGYKNTDEVVLHFDIQQTKELLNGWKEHQDYGSHKGLKNQVGKEEVDLVIGGPPCQAYSIAGRIRDKDGMKKDYRNYLFESYVQIVNEFKPQAFVFENVEGMLSAEPGGIPITKRIRNAFADIGYQITDSIRQKAVIEFSEYGVPQYRKRVILLGLNESSSDEPQKILDEFYTSILPKYKEEKLGTVEKAISDLPKFKKANESLPYNGRRLSHIPVNFKLNGEPVQEAYKKLPDSHIPRYHNDRDIQIFRELAEDVQKENPIYNSTEKLKKLYTERTGKKSNVHKYNVLNWDEPSCTIPAHLYKDGLRHIHPDPVQARTITPREAARLQTFDDDFKFIGGQSATFKMIGNAVPPQFSKHLASALNELFQNYLN